MQTWKQALAKHGTKPYKVKREPVLLLGGPFAGAIIWLDAPRSSSYITLPIAFNGTVGAYHDGGVWK